MAAVPVAAIHLAYAAARQFAPVAVLNLGGRPTCFVTRHDDVRQVLAADASFGVPYADKLSLVLQGDGPFILGLPDGPVYRRQLAALHAAVTPQDIGETLPQDIARRMAAHMAGRSEIDVVELVRRVTAETLCVWFGLTDVGAAADFDGLSAQAQILFRFQFADQGNDPALRVAAKRMAAQLAGLIRDRVALGRAGGLAPDTLIARYLAAADPALALTEAELRAAIAGFVVGGLPQAAMVVPNAVDQLLRRPEALDLAQRAAAAGDDAVVAACLFEAMRFDPLGPALERVVLRPAVTLAPGTRRARVLPQGARVLAFFASAMLDPRRVAGPMRFDPARHPSASLHFGHGLHQCFAAAINRRMLPALLKPLLLTDDLRRAPGKAGRLVKAGVFPERFRARL